MRLQDLFGLSHNFLLPWVWPTVSLRPSLVNLGTTAPSVWLDDDGLLTGIAMVAIGFVILG
jgi:hypothetical protein